MVTETDKDDLFRVRYELSRSLKVRIVLSVVMDDFQRATHFSYVLRFSGSFVSASALAFRSLPWEQPEHSMNENDGNRLDHLSGNRFVLPVFRLQGFDEKGF